MDAASTRVALLTIVLLVSGTRVASAGSPPSGYQMVASALGIPADLFYAMALQESGTKLPSGHFRPWPWTLNVEGRAERYRTRTDAFKALERHLAEGKTRVDIGLMQVSWHYHRTRFANVWQALDPYINLRVGGRILRERYAALGDWWQAVGAYHAPSASKRARARASRYRRHVARRLARLRGELG